MRKTCAALAVLAIPSVAEYAKGNSLVNDPEHIKKVNAEARTWEAGPQKFFEGMTFDDVRGLMGTAPAHIEDHLDEVQHVDVFLGVSDDAIPTDFDARKKWPGLLHPITQQAKCGGCWAFAASEVLGDRVAIVTGKPSPILSPQDLISCDTKDQGCNGGYVKNAWEYLTSTGIVTESCMPFASQNNTAPACKTSCADGNGFTRQKAKSMYALKGAAAMQKEIMTNGPIQSSMFVYQSFITYKSGIYKKLDSEMIGIGDHSIKLIGWGAENGQDYWLVANSWGTKWGEDGGYFRIARGDSPRDSCWIETRGPPYAGLPDVSSAANLVV
eukprot:TRINITY_DN68449_c0_g1_i1.p1 TRINITY_DN68449_c0_g1~~TRINITY_DN68449_c0_g1_i1.p1  ORF type:complete len:327 (+),score=64.67 TRINITY_DN68449_c0_g1_i1:67-1047(+)